MKFKKIISSFVSGAIMLNLLYPSSVNAENSDPLLAGKVINTGFSVSNNILENTYNTYCSPVYSYINENDDGSISKIEYAESTNSLNIEDYSQTFDLIESRSINCELPIFGGFYSGENFNYLVFGQSNESESNKTEVMRVVKYSKDWNRLDSFSVYGANTKIPFAFGSLRMIEVNGLLYVYTCHVMYKSNDGYNHQSNMTFVINTDTMTEKQSYYGIMNISEGYVSHSFNQFIQTNGNSIFRVDHGDAYPRGVSITKCSASGDITNVTYTTALKFGGNTGDNYTGATVGGFELSGSNCIIVGTSTEHSSGSDFYNKTQSNIFLSITNQNLSDTKNIWITDYSEGSGIITGTPQLVKYDNEKFLIMWQEATTESYDIYTKMLIVDGNGNKLTDIVTSNAPLSDCQPILASDGNIKWYVSDSEVILTLELNPYALEECIKNSIETRFDLIPGDVNINGKIEISDATDVLTIYGKTAVGLNTDDFTEAQKKAADINNDGKIDITDATLILTIYSKSAAGL